MDEAAILKSPPRNADATIETCRSRAAGSDGVDLDALVAEHGRQVTRLVSRLVDRPQDVEDIVQETFLAALVHGRRFRGDCRPSTWLSRIAVNRCRSFHRWRRVRRLVPLLTHDTNHSVETTVDEDRSEASEEIHRAVRRLAGKYREPIVLRYFEGLSIDETAEVLKLSRAAVEKRLSRARGRLKEILAERL